MSSTLIFGDANSNPKTRIPSPLAYFGTNRNTMGAMRRSGYFVRSSNTHIKMSTNKYVVSGDVIIVSDISKVEITAIKYGGSCKINTSTCSLVQRGPIASGIPGLSRAKYSYRRGIKSLTQ
ncbi:120aa long hypothetical protein [Pyrococcus horikoshii OT3]|uniref:Uncharacterized protein n=1 Tax=Pyrococcus horikoshii (strain ATCC 700860 / DSM 12428 / JCM 9974 / NBRC 100139 / OT-3) TaxID=70601 RepID=O58350_PYRHO|nr:120aa long hypothetical protein [Pyrococcus horikoshii OT3]